MEVSHRVPDIRRNDFAIDVVLAADANYAMPMSVVTCSTAINCAQDRLLRFHIIESGFSESLKQRILDSLLRVRPINSELYWYAAPTASIADLPIIQSHLTPMAYSRLLVPQLLPLNVKRALYLDCDVVVEGDVSIIWDDHQSDKALCAVRDRIDCVSNPGGLSNFDQLGIDPEAPYFNSGVLLFNVEKWREERIGERVFSYLKAHGHLLQFEDQEALNAVLHDDWTEVPGQWNQQIIPRSLRKRSRVALPDRIEGGILHFITSEKPWKPGCEYVERQHFYDFLDRTEWRGWRLPRWKELSFRGKRALGDLKRSIFRQEYN